MSCTKVIFACILIAFNINKIVNAAEVAPGDTTQNFRLFDEDNAVILDGKNLTSSIYDSTKYWVVGYYVKNETLPMDYMKVWKGVAHLLRILNDLNIATIQCIHENTLQDACIKQNVTSYSILKYYAPNTKEGSPGIPMETVNNITIVASDIIARMKEYEKHENKTVHPNIQHLVSSENQDHNQGDGTQNSSDKKAAWRNTSTYIIYVFIGLLATAMILWSSYSIFKRLSRTEVNVYSVLHKSETNDDDSIQVRLRY